MLHRALVWSILGTVAAVGGESVDDAVEARAVGFLAREVPRWSRENHCFSCHHNGDAARALFRAIGSGVVVDRAAIAATTRWLNQPNRWERNGGEGPFSDRRLARIQFTAALAEAWKSGASVDSSPLLEAAARLARDQHDDGSWPLEGENEPGSPATYGRPLATFMALRSLQLADAERFQKAIERADRWLRSRPVRSVLDASVLLLTLNATAATPPPDAESSPPQLLQLGLDRLREGQSDDGGWGPYVASVPEPFDTALALIALSNAGDSPEIGSMIARGRRFLVDRQLPDGSWPETTRPAGGLSEAQRLSTSAWVTIALLATRGRGR